MTFKQTGCFLIGVTGKGISKQGEALIGSVSDNPYDIRTFMKAVYTENAFAHIGTELVSTSNHTLTERGYFAHPDETTRGINTAGLAFTCAMVIEDEGACKPVQATPYYEITRQMMQHCKTVKDAIDLFASKEAIKPAYSVLLADAKGDLAHIEVGSFGMAVNDYYTSRNPGMTFAVNCYLSQKLLKYNAPHTALTNLKNNNYARSSRGQQLAQQWRGQLDVNTLARLLSDHANYECDPMQNPILPAWGYSICNHGTRSQNNYPEEDLPWGTVSAEILQPDKKLFWYCYGWPCGQKPSYGDQIFQGNSWGKFVAFGFEGTDKITETIPLTTVSGAITTVGLGYQSKSDPFS